jgi:hypothetical protein
MLTLIVVAVGAIASIASSAINANTAKKMAAVGAEIEALKLEEMELALEAEQQRTLQAAIKAKTEEFVQLQKSSDQQANRNTILLVGVLALTGYVSFLVLRPAPAVRQSKGTWFVGVGLVGVALVAWAFTKSQKVQSNTTSPPQKQQ